MRIARWLGIARSLATYYGAPFAGRRLVRFYRAFVQQGDLCFDIGAHVGNRTRALHRAGARVVAVEPQPDFVALLRRWYGHRAGITVLGEAVGAQIGMATLHISRRFPTVSTISAGWADQVKQARSFAPVRWTESVEVPVTTLDTLINRFGEPAFCKIDVEGSEYDILRGLSRPLRALSFEFIPAALNLALACLKRLEELGPYACNYTRAERLSFQLTDWVSPDQLADILVDQRSERSGDIIARRLDQAGSTHIS